MNFLYETVLSLFTLIDNDVTACAHDAHGLIKATLASPGANNKVTCSLGIHRL